MNEHPDEQVASDARDPNAGRIPVRRTDAPPIGLRPRWHAARARMTEIIEAMDRYTYAGTKIPSAWIEELGELNDAAQRSKDRERRGG